MKITLAILILLLTACATPFQPLTNNLGYNLFVVDKNTYRIEYVDIEPKYADVNWSKVAGLACLAELALVCFT